jgi:hypothetical protein
VKWADLRGTSASPTELYPWHIAPAFLHGVHVGKLKSHSLLLAISHKVPHFYGVGGETQPTLVLRFLHLAQTFESRREENGFLVEFSISSMN